MIVPPTISVTEPSRWVITIFHWLFLILFVWAHDCRDAADHHRIEAACAAKDQTP